MDCVQGCQQGWGRINWFLPSLAILLSLHFHDKHVLLLLHSDPPFLYSSTNPLIQLVAFLCSCFSFVSNHNTFFQSAAGLYLLSVAAAAAASQLASQPAKYCKCLERHSEAINLHTVPVQQSPAEHNRSSQPASQPARGRVFSQAERRTIHQQCAQSIWISLVSVSTVSLSLASVSASVMTSNDMLTLKEMNRGRKKKESNQGCCGLVLEMWTCDPWELYLLFNIQSFTHTHTNTHRAATCRSVLSISVASSCLPCLAISIISWIMPMRRW